MGRPPTYNDQIRERISDAVTYQAKPPYAARLLKEDVRSLVWAYADAKKEAETAQARISELEAELATLRNVEPTERARIALLRDACEFLEFKGRPEAAADLREF